MIAAVIRMGQSALGINGPAEFTAPDNEGLIEQAALLEIVKEGGARLIDVAALVGKTAGDVGVMVPVIVIDLDETDATLDEAAGEQGRISKGAGHRHPLAVYHCGCSHQTH